MRKLFTVAAGMLAMVAAAVTFALPAGAISNTVSDYTCGNCQQPYGIAQVPTLSAETAFGPDAAGVQLGTYLGALTVYPIYFFSASGDANGASGGAWAAVPGNPAADYVVQNINCTDVNDGAKYVFAGSWYTSDYGGLYIGDGVVVGYENETWTVVWNELTGGCSFLSDGTAGPTVSTY